MTDKITLTNLVNLTNQTTAVNAINANNAVLTTAFDNTLSRDGTQPNQMGSNLDMNGFQILNQGAGTATQYTVATLPASPLVGQLAVVTNGAAGLAWGATIINSGTTSYLVWWNGSAWTVLGK